MERFSDDSAIRARTLGVCVTTKNPVFQRARDGYAGVKRVQISARGAGTGRWKTTNQRLPWGKADIAGSRRSGCGVLSLACVNLTGLQHSSYFLLIIHTKVQLWLCLELYHVLL